MNKKFSPSKYPIVEAIMNPVSDLNLAISVSDAGCLPSLLSPSISQELDELLTEYYKSVGNMNINVSFSISSKDIIGMCKVITKHKPSHIELISSMLEENYKESDLILLNSKKIQNILSMIGVHTKVLMRTPIPFNDSILFDGYCIKGSDSAGKRGDYTVQDLFNIQKTKSPNKFLIPYGGVKSPQDVKRYLDNGASAVAVGTLFAASKESCLSNEVKQKMIESTSKDLTKSDINQSQLVLGNYEKIVGDDANRSKLLKKSLTGDGTSGFIYASGAIDAITEIKTVKEIVEYLTKDLSKKFK